MTQPTGLTENAYNLMWTQREAVAALRPPDEIWKANEVSDALANRLQGFINAGIVTVDGATRGERANREIHLYRTTDVGWQLREEVYVDDLPGPCNHSGIRCLDAEERVYTCLDADCDEEFGPDVARARTDGLAEGRWRSARAVADGGVTDA